MKTIFVKKLFAKKLWKSLLALSLISISSVTLSEDIELYVSDAVKQAGKKIKVLIILDNSGSMNDLHTVSEDFDPASDYEAVSSAHAYNDDATYFNNSWAAYDVPRHLWHFSQNSIHKLFTRFGMKIEKTIPMKFDAYYVSMLSEKYKGGNNVKAFFNGWRSNMKAKNGSYSSQIYILKKKGH